MNHYQYLLTAWVCEQELPIYQKMVLLMIAKSTDPETGVTIQTKSMLAHDCGMSEHTVKRCVRLLEEAGHLQVDRSRFGGQHMGNRYRLVLPEVA